MAYNWLTQLPRYLNKWGANWAPIDGWETRAAYGPELRPYTPVGLINHHTAGTDYYDPMRLLTKCNLYISPDGETYLISAGYQADSGMGDPNALMRVRNDQPPQPPGDYTSEDRINGNPWFIDIEVGHWGDGSPIPEPQRNELILVNAAIMDMQQWGPATRLIGHLEWTRRKIDPRWSWQGEPDSMDAIRADTARLLERSRMPIEQWHKMIRSLFRYRPDVFVGDPSYFINSSTDDPPGIADQFDHPDWDDGEGNGFWPAWGRLIGGTD